MFTCGRCSHAFQHNFLNFRQNAKLEETMANLKIVLRTNRVFRPKFKCFTKISMDPCMEEHSFPWEE
jgi:hypothetical protein